jgi:hypothetical protein
MEADLAIGSFVLEFGYFEEFVLAHAASAIAERLVSHEEVGSHNLRVGLALGQLNKQLALAIQAIWETHFRRWLLACAQERYGDGRYDAEIKRATLEDLDQRLKDIRGAGLDDFPSGKRLKELTLVGNVVRHGDGPSAGKLLNTAPEIWMSDPAESDLSIDECADRLVIDDVRLKLYADAVSSFWIAAGRPLHAQYAMEPPWVDESKEAG